MKKTILFDSWMPDYSPLAMPDGGLLTFRNGVRYDNGIYPVKQPIKYSSNSVSGTAVSGKELTNINGSVYTFIGTNTGLYRLNADKSIDDITKAATTYTTNGNTWNFQQYGTWVVATNYNDAPQVLKGFTSSNFVDLGGSPPKARFATFHHGQLVLGFLNDGTERPKKLIYSAYNDIEDFTPSVTTLADSVTFDDASGNMSCLGVVNGIMIVGFDASITLGYYTGAPRSYEFVINKEENIGVMRNTLVNYGSKAFFFDRKDIYYYDAETSPIPIGSGIKRTILTSIDMDNLHRITTAVDTQNNLTFWSIPTTSSSSAGRPNMILCLNHSNLNNPKFSIIEIDHHAIFNIDRQLLTMEMLDDFYSSVDEIPEPLDSNFWQQSSNFACIDTNNYISAFLGKAMTMEIETGDFYNGENGVFVFDNARILANESTDTISLKVGGRMNEFESPSYTNYADVNGNGFVFNRKSGRYLRGNIRAGLHKGLTGMIIDIHKQGAL